jgi:rubrerythrin/uncharacterized membrane protein
MRWEVFAMKWICTVCQYVHEGDAPPDVCPVCGQPKEMFEKVAEDSGEDAAASPREERAEKDEDKSAAKSSRKWICTVCKYVHEGDAPPDTCPVCKKPWSAFIPNVTGPDGPRLPTPAAKPKKKAEKSERWRCVVCNYIHNGPELPDVCPICGAAKDDFVPERESPVHHHRGFAGLIEKLHLHPVAAHFPNGALPLAFLAWVIYLILGNSCLERASFYLLLVATLAVPFTGFSGWSDAKHRFGTTTTGVFPKKKQWSWVLTGLTLGTAVWRVALGWEHVPQGSEIAVFTILLVGATAVAARLGMLGGKLVFGH